MRRASSLSRVRLFATLWTIAHQAPLSMGILQARTLEWVAIPSSKGSSQPRDQTQVSCNAGGLLPSEPPGKPWESILYITFLNMNAMERGSLVPLHRWGCQSQMLSQGQALEDGKLGLGEREVFEGLEC